MTITAPTSSDSSLAPLTTAPGTVQVLGPKVCSNCESALRLLDSKGFDCKKVVLDVSDVDTLDAVKKAFGGASQAPFVQATNVNGETVRWVSIRPDIIITRLSAFMAGEDALEGFSGVMR